jgi:hypothetical protein
MKRVLTGSFLAAAFAVGLSAQTTPPQTTPPTSQPPAQAQEKGDRDAAKTITVTGCLKAGDSANSFMLSDLKWGNKDKAVGTSGTAAPPAAVASATSLKVIPGASAKLSEHVGHQVEVTGTISDSKAPSTPPDPASTRSSSSAPSVEARSVRMVSQTCSGQ